MRSSPLFVALFALTGCGYSDSRLAHQAQINMEGMSLVELQSCAGVPDKVSRIDEHTQILTYNYKSDASGGIDVSLPIVGGGYTLGGSGSNCNATFRVQDGRVASLFYSGNNDAPNGEDAVCAPIVRGCMRRPQPSMIPLNDETRGRSSAYYQPPAPVIQPPPPPPADTVVRMEPVGR
ncbi:hypothetical protein IAI18_00985 [Acetobacteraceae bacterium H6797]|nr:hypothetical protein [Acetobacteraceae bacterium H6797]